MLGYFAVGLRERNIGNGSEIYRYRVNTDPDPLMFWTYEWNVFACCGKCPPCLLLKVSIKLSTVPISWNYINTPSGGVLSPEIMLTASRKSVSFMYQTSLILPLLQKYWCTVEYSSTLFPWYRLRGPVYSKPTTEVVRIRYRPDCLYLTFVERSLPESGNLDLGSEINTL